MVTPTLVLSSVKDIFLLASITSKFIIIGIIWFNYESLINGINIPLFSPFLKMLIMFYFLTSQRQTFILALDGVNFYYKTKY
jgi:uncharacterized membrane protein